MKKLLISLACLIAPVMAHAFSPVRYVQISTNTLTQQTGSFNVATGTVSGLTANKLTVVSSGTINGPLAVTGSFTQPMTVTSSITVPTLGVTSSINQALTVASSETVTGNFGVTGQVNQPLTATSSITVQNNFGVTGVVNKPLTVTSSMTVSNTLGATTFADATGRSIYGNFIASNTVTAGSSVTVTVSGYNGYVVRLVLSNATGSTGSAFLRINNDNSTNYSYATSGFLNTVSTGSACGNTAAKQILLTGVNNFNNGVRFSSTLSVDFNSVVFVTGDSVYQENSGNNAINANFGGSANIGSLTSIQAWVGQMQSCTVATDPLTGTTGSIWVWGVD